MRLRHSLLAGVTAFSVAVSGQPAYAWKPKTHVYLAEEALRDALDNGKVTIYETDQASGKILGPLGEFDVDPKILYHGTVEIRPVAVTYTRGQGWHQ